MFSTVIEATEAYVTPERLDVWQSAHDTLTLIGLSDHETELLTIVNLPDEITDSDQLVGRIEACYVYAVGGCLHQYGVTVIDGTPLPVMTELLQALGTFERYLIEEVHYDILTNNEMDDIEKLSEFIPLFSSLLEVDVTYYVNEVRESTMQRLVQVVSDELATHDVEAVTDVPYQRERIDMINTLMRDLPTTTIYPVRQIASYGIEMGADFDVILDMALPYLEDDNALGAPMTHHILSLAFYYSRDIEEPLDELADAVTATDAQKDRLLRQVDDLMQQKGWSYAQA